VCAPCHDVILHGTSRYYVFCRLIKLLEHSRLSSAIFSIFFSIIFCVPCFVLHSCNSVSVSQSYFFVSQRNVSVSLMSLASRSRMYCLRIMLLFHLLRISSAFTDLMLSFQPIYLGCSFTFCMSSSS
jgi:hypothetical protein